MDLPGEIRNEVYKLVLSRGLVPKGETAPLLLVSKLIHQEVKDFWYNRPQVGLSVGYYGQITNHNQYNARELFFPHKLSLPWFQDSRVLFTGPQFTTFGSEFSKRQRNFTITIAIIGLDWRVGSTRMSAITATTLSIATALENRKDINTIKIRVWHAVGPPISSRHVVHEFQKVLYPFRRLVRSVKSVRILYRRSASLYLGWSEREILNNRQSRTRYLEGVVRTMEGN